MIRSPDPEREQIQWQQRKTEELYQIQRIYRKVEQQQQTEQQYVQNGVAEQKKEQPVKQAETYLPVKDAGKREGKCGVSHILLSGL
jgi:hypothetical protein